VRLTTSSVLEAEVMAAMMAGERSY
jgi:hypothetical protein